MRTVLANTATAAYRRAYFDLRNIADGITPETGEAGGQPQISTDGGSWTNTGIGVLIHIGNGRYYADLTQTAVATAGNIISTRYKSANTIETPGDTIQVVAYDYTDSVRLGLTALPNADADAVGGLFTQIDSGVLDSTALDAMADANWDEARSGHVAAGSFGEYVNADTIAISGGSTAADNAELFFDNTGFNASNSIIGYVSTIGQVIETPNVNVAQISGDSTAADNLEAAFDGDGYDIGGIDVSELNQIVDDLIDGGRLDLLVDAIKAKTDDITFTTANKVDARVDNWAGTAVSTSSTTNLPEVDAASISDDSVAANNAEAFFDNDGFNASNSTIGTVTDITNASGTSPAAIWGYASRGLTDTVNLSSATETQIDNIETDTNEIQGKLPTNYIMGSSDQSDLDDDIIGIQTDLDNATDGLGALKALIDTIDTVVDAIQTVTDNLPDSGSLNDLATLASRLTAARAGYLDSLNTGVTLTSATETQIDNIEGYVDDIQGDVTTSLNAYDPPTRTEATADKDEIIAGQSSGGTTPAAIWGYASRTLTNAPDNWSSMQIDSVYGYVKVNQWQFEDRFIELVDTVDSNLIEIKGNTSTVDNLEDDYDGTGYNKANSTVGTVTDITNAVSADVTQISGDSTAADNAEAFFDDSGFDASNSTIGTTTDVTNAVTVTGTPNVNVAQISGDSIAADNAEAFFDNTGFNASNSTIGYATTVGQTIQTPNVNVIQIVGYTLTETQAGTIGKNFETFFDVFPPTSKTVNDVGVAGSGLTSQQVRDAMKLAPTAGSPASGSIDETMDKMDDTLEDDAGTFRFTENALEQAPTGAGGGGTSTLTASQVWTYGYRSLTTASVGDVYTDTQNIIKMIQAKAGN